MTEMKVKALAPWFGGKRTLAPLIVQELGKHGQYFEPCCGSMAVLFAKEPSQKETVNDLHGELINLAHVVANESFAIELYSRLGSALFCETMLQEAQAYFRLWPECGDLISVERAYWYFLACWMGRKGTAGTERQDYQIAVRFTKNGGSSTMAWRSAVESIPAWHRRLQNVVILKRDLFKIIDRFEDVKETAIYVDPPYHVGTRGTTRNGSGGRYLHEFNHEASLMCQDDHTRLRDALNEYKRARVVVSYYDHPEIRRLYKGWTFVECGRQKNLARQNRASTSKGEAPEVLIINGKSFTEES